MVRSFIMIDRKILKWEWYKNEHTKNVFLHCLLKAYWKDTKIEGKIIPRGSFVSSIGNIAEELALTQMEVRTALKHLKSTNEITSIGTNKNTVFTVTNYDLYQSEQQAEEQTSNKQITNKKQSDNEQITNEQQSINKPLTTNKEYNNINKDKESIEGKERKEVYEFISVETEKTNRSDIETIMQAWNSLDAYGIKPVSRMKSGTARYKSLVARMKEYSVDEILSAIENIKRSDFLQGKNNKGWVITFDWFVLPNNFPKVFDGNYVKEKPQNNSGNRFVGTSKDEQFQKLMEQIRRDEENANRGC